MLDLAGTPWRWLLLSERHDLHCLVDADDWPWIVAVSWNYGWHNRTPWKYYAKRNVGPARSTVYLHREIMWRAQEPPSAGLHVDHINGNSLDNRKANLRWVTPLQNNANKHRRARIPSLDRLAAALVAGLVVLDDAPF